MTAWTMCRSDLNDEQITALVDGIKARRETVCRACGAPAPIPTFLARDEWECASVDCRATWTVDR